MHGSETQSASHYERLADSYDENWSYSPQFLRWMSSEIAAALRLTADDRIADLGCGTGLFDRELLTLVEPKEPILCVDASAAMLQQVPPDPRLRVVHSSAEDIAAGRTPLPYQRLDAIVMKEVIHHVDDAAAVLNGLAGLLAPGGRILVAMLPTRIDYPLFRAALERFEAVQPDPEVIAAHLRAAGLATTLDYASFPLTFDTDRYLNMVRSRYMSLLSMFDDAQLAAGVAEIRAAHPEGRLSFTDRFAFVVGMRDDDTV